MVVAKSLTVTPPTEKAHALTTLSCVTFYHEFLAWYMYIPKLDTKMLSMELTGTQQQLTVHAKTGKQHYLRPCREKPRKKMVIGKP